VWTPVLKKELVKQLPVDNCGLEIGEKSSVSSSLVYNRIDHNYNLSNKKNLFLNMKEYYESTGEDLHSNIPLTFLVEEESKLESVEEFKDFFNNNNLNNKNNQWILKPGEFTNRGKGIQICK